MQQFQCTAKNRFQCPAGGGGAAGSGVCADADGRRQDPAGLSELRL